MPRGPEPEPRGRAVAQLTQLRFGRRGRHPDDRRPEHRRAVLRVGVCLRAAEPVMDVRGTRPVAERSERVPEAGRVGATRDEARELAPGRREVVEPNMRLDALQHAHVRSVPSEVEGGADGAPPSAPRTSRGTTPARG